MKTLLTAEQIRGGIARLAGEVRARYVGQPLTVIGVLVGSMVLVADLIRRLDMPLRLGLIQARSYGHNATRPGNLTVNLDLLSTEVHGRHVLLVDDIFDTGHTLEELVPRFADLGAASVRTAVLLRKQGRAEVALQPDFVAFDVPDVFVVGYGLDYNDMYRNLPYVAALEPHEIARECPA